MIKRVAIIVLIVVTIIKETKQMTPQNPVSPSSRWSKTAAPPRNGQRALHRWRAPSGGPSPAEFGVRKTDSSPVSPNLDLEFFLGQTSPKHRFFSEPINWIASKAISFLDSNSVDHELRFVVGRGNGAIYLATETKKHSPNLEDGTQVSAVRVPCW